MYNLCSKQFYLQHVKESLPYQLNWFSDRERLRKQSYCWTDKNWDLQYHMLLLCQHNSEFIYNFVNDQKVCSFTLFSSD
jgi:hypothetical protein